MANPKRDIYTDIKARILDQVKEIKHVLLFNNQFEKDKEEQAFTYPNAFVEFSQLIWNTNGQQTQKGEMQLTIHLGFESLKYEADNFDIIQSVFVALQGYSNGCYTGLNRIQEEQDTDHDNVIIWKIIFETTIDDTEAHPSNKLQENTISTIEINKDLDIDNPIIRTGDGIF